MGAPFLRMPGQGLPVGRSYLIEPSPCGGAWVLTLFEDGQPMGGGRFMRLEDSYGFDAGYQDALDQAEAWL